MLFKKLARWAVSLGLVFTLVSCAVPTASPVQTVPPVLAPTQPAPPTVTLAPVTDIPSATATVGDLPTAAPLYLDPQADTQTRVDDLLARMTLEEKIGQMTQVEKDSIAAGDIRVLSIGSILSGGGGAPQPNTPEAWAKMVDGFQSEALKTRLAIPLIYGVDAVHGHNNLYGATIFPHNIGLGATNDPILLNQIGRATAEEMAATGIRWNFAPVVAVPQDIRWGRTYEGYSESTHLVAGLGMAYLSGLQGPGRLNDPTAVLATPKHYIGDGGTLWGSSTTENYKLDQGDMQVDEATLRAQFLPPYQAAINAGAQSIMVSFNSWNGTKLHGQKQLLTGVLKNELGFTGFLISDWKAIDQLPGDYYADVVASINAGLDMIMVPYDYKVFIMAMTQAANSGDIPQARIDDAVRRILTVKFNMGLFEAPYSDPALLPMVGSDAHRDLARKAVAQSLVLLKNENLALPVSKKAELIYVAGRAADNIGIQCGGWTITWQGKSGDITPGTTILAAIQATAGSPDHVKYDPIGKFADEKDANGNLRMADVGVVVVGEDPYAEGLGDNAGLTLSTTDIAAINHMRERSKKVIVVLISGRPMIITEQLPLVDAWVAAWLPGTEGQGVADVLFGDLPFTGKLPFTWPSSADQLPININTLKKTHAMPLFPFGYGLGD